MKTHAKRVIRSGITHFFRNIWVSIAATSMVAITLFIISTILVLYALAVLSIDNSTDKVGVVTAYFNDKTTDAEMARVRAEVVGLPGVKQVVFTSKDQAKQNFAQKHSNEPILLQTLSEFQNPVPASLSVKADNLNAYHDIYNNLNSTHYSSYFSRVSDNQKVIDKLYKIIKFIKTFGAVLAGVFMVVTVMVTFNTIRLTIYNRREEVEIMRLVGATNWFIRWPFIIEGVLYSLFATAFTSVIVLGLLFLLSARIEQFLSISRLGSNFIAAIFWPVLLVNIIASVTLSIIASSIAIRRYLKI